MPMSTLPPLPLDALTAPARSQERYRKVAINASASLIGKAVTAVTLLMAIPIVLDHVGRELFGLWATLYSLTGLLLLADLGIGNAVVNAIASSSGRNDRAAAAAAVSSAFFLLVAQSLGLLLIAALAYHVVDWASFFGLADAHARQQAAPALLALGCIVALQLPLAIVNRVQEGYQEAAVNHLWQSLGNVVGLSLLLAVVSVGLGLPWVVAALAGGPSLAMLGNWLVQAGHQRRWLRPRWRLVERIRAGAIVRSGLLFSGLAAFTWVGIYSDIVVISWQLGSDAVAEYAVVQRLSLVAHLFYAFITALWPAYGEAFARGDVAWVRKTFRRSFILSMAFGALFATLLVGFGKELVALWVGPSVNPSPGLLYGFASFVFVNAMMGNIAVLMSVHVLVRTQLVLMAIAAVGSFALKIILCAELGAAGPVWASVIAFGACYVIPGLFLVRSTLARS
jgi:O-antigen/teichoic acid export membrane protein